MEAESTLWASGLRAACSTAQTMPAMMVAALPVPVQVSTCTLTTSAALATPCVLPAAIEAQCVPCDEQLAPDEPTRPSCSHAPDEHAASWPVWHP